jgi:hypothetical protein
MIEGISTRHVSFVGAGKTLISVMLVKEKSSGMLREETFEEGRQITIFLAPKVALVWQVRYDRSSSCTSKTRLEIVP